MSTPNVPTAAPPTGVAATSAQYLTFSLGDEMFAVGTLTVKEIIEYGKITSVPMMPAFMRGVINLRGAVVPVIDLGVRLRGEITAVTRRTCIVILEIPTDEDAEVLGIVVDAVNEVLEIAAADIEPPPAFGAGIPTDFIAGMGKIGGQFVIVLNVGKVLSTEEIGALAGVTDDDHAV